MQVEQVRITQAELQEIFDLDRAIEPMQKRSDELKSNLKALLIHNMPVERGRFFAKLIKRFNRHVTWRQCVVENLGLDFAEKYKKLFKPRMFCDVMVEEHAVAPLWKDDGGGSIDVM